VSGIVVGLDTSPESIAALRWAADLATHTATEVIAVHAEGMLEEGHYVPRVDVAALVDASLAGTQPPNAVTVLVEPGSPCDTLLRVAERTAAGHIVVGHRGIGDTRSDLGSTAMALVRRSTVPVTVVRDSGQERGVGHDAARALACLDLTSLNLDDTAETIDVLCDRALSPPTGIAIRPAAVCIYPRFVAQVRARLLGSGINVAAVANFPAGTAPADDVAAEVEQALADGADEIDVVFPFRSYLAGDQHSAEELLRRVSDVCRHRAHPATLKVILETGVLEDPAIITAAARLAVANGAMFLKTSTGKLEPAATPEAAQALLEVAAEAHRHDGRSVGVKVAGGVKSVADASVYLELADRHLSGGANPGNFRFGASGLLNDIVAVLGGSEQAPMSAEY
jgi:deoxyribose-phosphate aldolase